jgi:hypothetical protein
MYHMKILGREPHKEKKIWWKGGPEAQVWEAEFATNVPSTSALKRTDLMNNVNILQSW